MWRRRDRTDPPEIDLTEQLAPDPEPAQVLTLTPSLDVRSESLLAAVTDDLTTSDSGIDFVYRSLDRMQARSRAEDVIVIVEEPPLGRQAFRAGRRPIETDWARELVRSGAPGLHSKPQPVDEAVASSVVKLCAMALRLDVARHDSLHDPLTGLLNRRAFDELLESTCSQSRRYGWSFALVVLDLDHFKVVNDVYGHAAGDAVLVAIGGELRHGLRAGDAAARIGGDEFALVLPNVTRSEVLDVLLRLDEDLTRAVPDTPIRVSAGAAVSPDDASEPEALFRIADNRLYEGKRR